MDYIINFLSLLIIWSILYYYINNYDSLKTEPFEDTLCNFKPWGDILDACVDRCIVSGITKKLEDEIGSGCNKAKCRGICNNCTDITSCKWLKQSNIIITQTETTDNIMCIPGNNEIKVNFYYNTDTSTTTPNTTKTEDTTTMGKKKKGFFVIQHYKSRFPHEGIYITKVDANSENNNNYYALTLNKNIVNDFEYSVLFYYVGADETIDYKNMNQLNSSNIVMVTPSESNSII
jgi:hypothetical protein